MRAGWPAWEGSEFENYVIIWSVYCAEKLYTNLVKPVRHHFTVSSSKIGKTLVFITNCTAVSHTHTHTQLYFHISFHLMRLPESTLAHIFTQLHSNASSCSVDPSAVNDVYIHSKMSFSQEHNIQKKIDISTCRNSYLMVWLCCRTAPLLHQEFFSAVTERCWNATFISFRLDHYDSFSSGCSKSSLENLQLI